MTGPSIDFTKAIKKKKEDELNSLDFSKAIVAQPPDEYEDSGGSETFHALGNFVRYTKELVTNPATFTDLLSTAVTGHTRFMNNDVAKSLWNNLKTTGEKIFKSISDPNDMGYQRYRQVNSDGSVTTIKTPSSDLDYFKKGLEGAKELFTTNPLHTIDKVGASLLGMIQTPIEAITATSNVDGTPVKNTPEQQASKIQAAVALAGAIATQSYVARAALPELEGEQALSFLQKSRMGKLAKTIGGESLSTAAAGAVQSGIENIGKEDETGKMIQAAIAFIPLGMFFGLVKTKGYTNDAATASDKFLADPTTAIQFAQNDMALAAANHLKIGVDDTLENILANTDALANNSKAIKAAVQAKLDVKQGIIVEGLNDEQITNLQSSIAKSQRVAPEYEPSPQIQSILNRSNPNNTGLAGNATKFVDQFDKAAYLASGKGRNAFKIRADLQASTGLSPQEIIAHGKAVREAIRTAVKNRDFKALDQAEIDQLNQQIKDHGEAKLNSMGEGMIAKDYLGNTWTKLGNTITDGKLVLDTATDDAKMILGRNKKFVDPTTGQTNVIEIGKQNFQPEFGRKAYEHNLYVGKNGNTLILPDTHKLLPHIDQFFKDTGFLPNEIVTDAGGLEYIVRSYKDGKLNLEGIQGSTNDLSLTEPQLKFIKRSGAIDSEFYKQGNETLFQAGVVNPKNYFNHMYDKFKESGYSLESETPFANQFEKFAYDMGIKSKQDRQVLQLAFVKRIREDLISTLDEDTKADLDRLGTLFENNISDINSSLGLGLYHSADASGLYIVPEGAGKYAIKFKDSGNTYATVNNYADALDQISRARQPTTYDLDGGYAGNVIPPGAAAAGRVSTPLEIQRTAKKWDDFMAGGFGYGGVPFQRMIMAMDSAYGTNIWGSVVDPLQKGLNAYKYYLKDKLQKLGDIHNDAAKVAKDMNEAELHHTSDYMEALSIEQIKNDLMHRKMNNLETTKADELSKIGTDNIVKYMNEVREAAGDAKVNSEEFATARNKIAANYDKKVVAAADPLFNNNALPFDEFSTYATLRLARALEDPASALTREEYLNVLKSKGLNTAKIKELAEKLDNLYAKGAKEFGITEKSKLSGYVPHAKIAKAAGHNPYVINELDLRFAHEMTRMGYVTDAAAIRDPIELAKRYILSGGRVQKVIDESYFNPLKQGSIEKLSLQDMLKYANDALYKKVTNEKGQLIPEQSGIIAKMTNQDQVSALGTVMDQHFADIQGLPRTDVKLAKATENIFTKMGFTLNNATAAFTTSTQGGRLMLGLRDFVNFVENSYSLYGREFTQKILNTKISKEYIEALNKKGALPNTKGLDLVFPGEDIEKAISRLDKMTETAVKLSGQPWVYTITSAKLYKATVEHLAPDINKVIRGEMDKARFMDKHDLDLIPESQRKTLDNYIIAGNAEAVADLVARARIGQSLNNFGNYNNPLGWHGKWGRALGHTGSWGANQIQTFGDVAFRGSGLKRSQRLLRYGLINSVVWGTGAAVGLEMKNWLTIPLGLLQVGPNVQRGIDLMKHTADALLSNNPNARQRGIQELKRYGPVKYDYESHQYTPNLRNYVLMPYASATQDWIDAWQNLNKGFVYNVAPTALGARPVTTQRSLLDKATGNRPKLDRR